ncbi:hypothetical protein ACFW04_012679 [Cataglyphis niger]
MYTGCPQEKKRVFLFSLLCSTCSRALSRDTLRYYHENCPTKHRILDPLIGKLECKKILCNNYYNLYALPLPRITQSAELPRMPCCSNTGRESLPPGIRSYFLHVSHIINNICQKILIMIKINRFSFCKEKIRRLHILN